MLTFYEFLENQIIVDQWHLNHAYGQDDYIIFAKDGDTVVGRITFSVYEGVPKINMIEVAPEYQRQGIGKKMIDKLVEEYPYSSIEWGYMTDDGAALKNSLDKIYKV